MSLCQILHITVSSYNHIVLQMWLKYNLIDRSTNLGQVNRNHDGTNFQSLKLESLLLEKIYRCETRHQNRSYFYWQQNIYKENNLLKAENSSKNTVS